MGRAQLVDVQELAFHLALEGRTPPSLFFAKNLA